MSSSKNNFSYRPEIDGLRAFAVIAVILYHAGFSFFKGGFVGVDVFFVISGYLISSIIYTEIQNGSFTFSNFYARRAGRIIPALFFVIAVCIPFAYVYLLPDDLKEFSRSVISTTTFVSNIFFMKQSGYFDTAIELKPLIHTWSLGVEEQFYIFFPILLALAFKFKRSMVLPLLFVLGLISFTLAESELLTKTANFYVLPTRAWELMIGAVISIYFIGYQSKLPINERTANIFGIIGLSAIVLSITLLSKDLPYPGVYTLPPTIGTALILLSRSKNSLSNKILSAKYFVGIGLISYSAYLWHQPLFAFARHISIDDPDISTFGFLSATSFLLAYLTWKYVETPARNLAKVNKKAIFLFYIIVSILFICLALWSIKQRGCENRFPIAEKLKMKDVKCTFPSKNICLFSNNRKDNPEFAVFGDSHAVALAPMFFNIQKQHNKSYIFSTQASCPPLLGVYVIALDPEMRDACYYANQERFQYIKDHPSIKKIFLISRWTRYVDGNYKGKQVGFLGLKPTDVQSIEISRRSLKKSISQTFEDYKKLGVELYVVLQAPQQQLNVSQQYMIAESRELNTEQVELLIKNRSVKNSQHLALQSFSRNYINEESKRYGVNVINLDEFFCKNNYCAIGEPGNPYYVDYDHLSTAGAMNTSARFLDLINKP